MAARFVACIVVAGGEAAARQGRLGSGGGGAGMPFAGPGGGVRRSSAPAWHGEVRLVRTACRVGGGGRKKGVASRAERG